MAKPRKKRTDYVGMHGGRSKSVLRKRIAEQWSKSMSTSELEELLRRLCIDCDSAFSLAVMVCLRYQDYDGLLSLDVSPKNYCSPKAFYLDNLLLSMLKKYPHWPASVDPEQQARDTFLACETKCHQTNQRILGGETRFSPAVSSILMFTQRKISRILGEVPDVTELPFRFGPGSTFALKGHTGSFDKLAHNIETTPEAFHTAVEFLQSCPGWLALHGVAPDDHERIAQMVTLVPGDRLSFVPKTAKTHRPIAVGPLLNVVIQKGYGSYIRKQLGRVGLNLNRLPERHRELARQSSVDDSLSTIDLSSASDLISFSAVLELLPLPWVDALDTVRSHRYLDTETNRLATYHKFSAMGNGYTFELESLIFYTLALAVCDYLGLPCDNVSSFGDDIIIPKEGAELLVDVLQQLGFAVNEDKSFVTGPFKESCGGDFWLGINVRGFYVKEQLTLQRIIELRNYLERNGCRFWVPRLWRKLRNLTKFAEPILLGFDDGCDDHIVSCDVPDSKPFDAVVIASTARRRPPRMNLMKTWMLYMNQTGSYSVWGCGALTDLSEKPPTHRPGPSKARVRSSARRCVFKAAMPWAND